MKLRGVIITIVLLILFISIAFAQSGVRNSPPKIDSYNPLNNPSIKEGDSFTFSITKSDPQNDTLTVRWYSNNVLVSQNQDTYTYESSTLPADAISVTYPIKVVVSDGVYEVSKFWSITVEKKIIPQTIKKTPICGDGVIDEEEDCYTCPKDVFCFEGEECIFDESFQKGFCQEKKSYMIFLLIFFLAILGVGLIWFFYYFNQKRKEYKIEESEESKEDKLEEYITNMLDAGSSISQIKKILIKKGWKEEIIDKKISDIKK